MDEITANLRFVPVEGLEVSEVPDGRVIYQTSRERVHFLNATAVVVFELCGLEYTVAGIQKFMQDAYSLAEPPIEEVAACIRNLLNEDLIRPS